MSCFGSILPKALALALALGGCECEQGEVADTPPDTETGGAGPASAYYPLTVGDRWRISLSGGLRQNTGVTGIDDNGIAAVVGTLMDRAERYRSTEAEVSRTTPSGRVLFPVLRNPLIEGESFEYEFADDDLAIPCTAEVGRTGLTHTIGSAQLSDCVEIIRSCRYAAGSPFTQETEHRTEELYCRGVGWVREHGRFIPPPPTSALPAERTQEVVAYRVAGAPVQPERGDFDCDDLILLPSDVAAACGPEVRPDDSPAGVSGPGTCRYDYARGALRLSVVASTTPLLFETDAAASDGGAAGRQTPALHVEESGVVVEVIADDGVCPEDRIHLLEPLLRSLLQ